MRGPSRTAYADPEVALSSDGTTVLSAGDSRLELWRSDMVRMISYGALDARIKPGVPGPGAVPAGIRGGQHGRGFGARGVPGPARSAADAAAARQGGGHPRPQIRAAARRQGGLRRPGGRGLRDHHGRLRTEPEAIGHDHRRDRLDDGQPAAAQAAVAGGRRNPPRRSDHLVDGRRGDGVLRQRHAVPLHRRPGRHPRSDRPGDDDGRAADHPGQRRRRRLRPDDGSQRALHPVAPPARAVGGGARRRRLDPARAARRHARRPGSARPPARTSPAPCPTSSA